MSHAPHDDGKPSVEPAAQKRWTGRIGVVTAVFLALVAGVWLERVLRISESVENFVMLHTTPMVRDVMVHEAAQKAATDANAHTILVRTVNERGDPVLVRRDRSDPCPGEMFIERMPGSLPGAPGVCMPYAGAGSRPPEPLPEAPVEVYE